MTCTDLSCAPIETMTCRASWPLRSGILWPQSALRYGMLRLSRTNPFLASGPQRTLQEASSIRPPNGLDSRPWSANQNELRLDLKRPPVERPCTRILLSTFHSIYQEPQPPVTRFQLPGHSKLTLPK